MSDPFDLNCVSGAVFSDDRQHRFWLWRIWDRSRPLLVVCMFNPSNGNGTRDDPTVLAVCDFARRWGYGGILIINLNSLVSPDPSVVHNMPADKRSGDAQPAAMARAIQIAREQDTPILCAWGNLATPEDAVTFIAAAGGVDLVCLGHNANGSPVHPSARGKHRPSRDQEPVVFRVRDW